MKGNRQGKEKLNQLWAELGAVVADEGSEGE